MWWALERLEEGTAAYSRWGMSEPAGRKAGRTSRNDVAMIEGPQILDANSYGGVLIDTNGRGLRGNRPIPLESRRQFPSLEV